VLYNRKIDRALILIIPAALFIYESARPQVRLRAEMPPEFMDAPAHVDPARQAAEERLAHEYWNIALNVIQWKYTYGSPLPNVPPEEFHVTTSSTTKGESDSSSRLRYWQRLQHVWLLPASWKVQRVWSTSWLTGSIGQALTWIESAFNDFFHGR